MKSAQEPRGEFSDETFEKVNYQEKPLHRGDYENCEFKNCDFSGAQLTDVKFIDCSFISSDLSNLMIKNVALNNVKFSGCKMLGFHFDRCHPFGLSFGFTDCILDYATFYQLKIMKTIFKNCSIREGDFTEADLSHAVFEQCDLDKVIFDNTILDQADLRTAYHFSLNMEKNKAKKAKFAIPGVLGLLSKYDIVIEGLV